MARIRARATAPSRRPAAIARAGSFGRALLLALVLSPAAGAAPAAEDEAIVRLDREAAAAVLAADLDALARLWSPALAVNAPIGAVLQGREAVFERIRDGRIRYARYEAHTESVLRAGDTAVVMGRETVRPIARAPYAGQRVVRRYSNVWQRQDGQWLMIARHAHVVEAGPGGDAAADDARADGAH